MKFAVFVLVLCVCRTILAEDSAVPVEAVPASATPEATAPGAAVPAAAAPTVPKLDELTGTVTEGKYPDGSRYTITHFKGALPPNFNPYAGLQFNPFAGFNPFFGPQQSFPFQSTAPKQ